MGGTTFSCTANGETAKAAFNAAVEQAYYDNGHSGYSGSICEKPGFVMITQQAHPLVTAEAMADDLINKSDPRVDDKWGDAGCIPLTEGGYLFFGWASC